MNFFGRKSESSRFNVEKTKKTVDRLMAMRCDELYDNEKLLANCLTELENKVTQVQRQAKKGDIAWLDGVALASYAKDLATHLADKNLIEHEAKATHLWAAATLSVCGHYHHLVGPAVVANGKIREKSGDIDFARQAYHAVVLDFESVLEDCEQDDTKPFGEDLISIESLQYAVKRLIHLENVSPPDAKLLQLKGRIESVMAKPSE